MVTRRFVENKFGWRLLCEVKPGWKLFTPLLEIGVLLVKFGHNVPTLNLSLLKDKLAKFSHASSISSLTSFTYLRHPNGANKGNHVLF